MNYSYSEAYLRLKKNFDINTDCLETENEVQINNFDFVSEHGSKTDFEKEKVRTEFHSLFKENIGLNLLYKIVNVNDLNINENHHFRYSVFSQKGCSKARTAIFLFHGLNEKDWDKYLPWAEYLCLQTGHPVVLFPIAFHMNRAPREWADAKAMNLLALERKKLFPKINGSSFANAAISTRLQFFPIRFFKSGLQTYLDFIQLIEQIRSDHCPYIAANARLNFFAYSIGSFLSEIILFTNEHNYFSNSNLFVFCGGPTFNRMCPVSKYILDSEANIALYSFYIEHLDAEMKNDEELHFHFTKENSVGYFFKAMLDCNKMRKERTNRLNELSGQIKALALEKDSVVPPYEVLNFFKGELRNIPIEAEIVDFPYTYRHEQPFPFDNKKTYLLDEAFNQVFNKAVDFLK